MSVLYNCVYMYWSKRHYNCKIKLIVLILSFVQTNIYVYDIYDFLWDELNIKTFILMSTRQFTYICKTSNFIAQKQ